VILNTPDALFHFLVVQSCATKSRNRSKKRVFPDDHGQETIHIDHQHLGESLGAASCVLFTTRDITKTFYARYLKLEQEDSHVGAGLLSP
jgi:hypothetical protein